MERNSYRFERLAECLEATPQHLRIQIDRIFQEFLSDPEQIEYIFEPDLNNTQRKYIHNEARKLNLISKSYGVGQDRRLHIKKRPKQTVSKTFKLKLIPEIVNEIGTFSRAYTHEFERVNARPLEQSATGIFYDMLPMVPPKARTAEDIQYIQSILPIYARKRGILEAIRDNQVTIVSSETGSGKTTQVPQYILNRATRKNEPCKIVCTQPRRLNAVAAASRVTFERYEPIGTTVGYHIKLELVAGRATNLLFCTVGTFLRKLMAEQNCLKGITHIIIDEIHERDKLTDFLLICLRQHLPKYPNLKLILMSATIEPEKFTAYFNGGSIVTVEGRSFPIDLYHLDEILLLTNYFTPKMKQLKQKKIAELNALTLSSTAGASAANIESASTGNIQPTSANTAKSQPNTQENIIIPEMDQGLEDYLNFENYDYKEQYDEATVQLQVYFLSDGYPVDYKHSQTGMTALMVAACLGDVTFTTKLCNMGANLDLTSNENRTASDYANLNHHVHIVALLEEVRRHRKLQLVEGTSYEEHREKERKTLLKLYDSTTFDDVIDYDLIVEVIKHIIRQKYKGAILIFLPGYEEIMRCNEYITSSTIYEGSYKVFFLHGSMNIGDQRNVFVGLPAGQRKIILSTNIAETSLTIPDVICVIDVGRSKQLVYDSYNKITSLQTQWISQTCAEQRKGRAGRVRPGYCFRLYSKQRFNSMDKETIPEMLRVSLEELCLHSKILAPENMDIRSFLSLAPDPPAENSIKVAIEHLQSLGALDKDNEDLLLLGSYLAQLPIEPRLGKMVIYACIFRCLEPVLTLASAMTNKDPFQLPAHTRLKSKIPENRREMADNVLSDQIVYLKLFQKWQDAVVNRTSKRFCQKYSLSEAAMCSILETRKHIFDHLAFLGFIPVESNVNGNSASWGLVKAMMTVSLYPNIAYPNQHDISFSTRNEAKVSVHNSSLCSIRTGRFWMCYNEMVKNGHRFFIRGVTAISPFTVAMMCGLNIAYEDETTVKIDNFIGFVFPNDGFIRLRKALENLVQTSLLNPRKVYRQIDYDTLSTLRNVLDIDENNSGWVQPTDIAASPKFVRLDKVPTSSSTAGTSRHATNFEPLNASVETISSKKEVYWMPGRRRGRGRRYR